MQVTLKHPRRALLASATALALVGTCAFLLFRHMGGAPLQRDAAADRMTAELLRAAERADICTAANAVGTGLRAEYFPENALRGTARVVRVDEVIDFDSAVKWPAGPDSPAVRSVRWSGWIKAPLSGKYLFHADAPHMQISVARKVVAGDGVGAPESVELAAGRFYPVEIVVSELPDSDKRIRLEWTAPHGARYVVPKALLNPPTDTVAPPRG